MRRRLAFLLVMSSLAAGCSLLVEFDRGKLGSLEPLDAADDVTKDGGGDVTAADGTGGNDTGTTDSSNDVVTDVTQDVTDGGTDAPVDAPVDSPNDAPQDSPVDSPVDSPADAPVDSPVDAPADAANDAPDDAADAADATDGAVTSAYCTQSEFDATEMLDAGTVTINFPEIATPNPYTPRCIKIAAGTVVTFHGDFGSHPLVGAGVSPNNPIPSTPTATASDGGTVGDRDFTFSAAGTYDFHCQIHFAAGMNGSIQVVP